MATNIRTIIRIADFQMEDFKTELDFMQKVYKTAGSEIEDYLKSEIDYVVPLEDTNFEPSDFIIGAKEPERLKEEAGRWNETLLNALQEAVKPFERFQSAKKFTSFADAFIYMERAERAKCVNQEFQSCTGQPYDTSLYTLRHSLGMLDDRFLYGDDMAVLSDWQNPYSYSMNVKLSPEELAHLNEHPEEYAILDVLYD